jgi:hypothetical protein
MGMFRYKPASQLVEEYDRIVLHIGHGGSHAE